MSAPTLSIAANAGAARAAASPVAEAAVSKPPRRTAWFAAAARLAMAVTADDYAGVAASAANRPEASAR